MKEFIIEYTRQGSGIVQAKREFGYSSTDAWNRIKSNEKANGFDINHRKTTAV